MSQELFQIVQSNPNDVCGGGGCACSAADVSDCLPPYAVFYANDMENPQSPHVVVCLKCMDAACRAAKLEIGAGGETAFDTTAEELPVPAFVDAGPAFDDEYEDLDLVPQV